MLCSTKMSDSCISGDSYILSSQQVDSFHKDGYIVLEDVVTEEEMKDIEEIYFKLINKEVNVEFGEDYGDHSSPPGTAMDNWKMINVTIPSIHFPPFANNIFARRGMSIAKQLYKDLPLLWDYDQLLAKKPNRPDAIFPLHQDSGYWYTPPDISTATATLSLAINDANIDNGCLHVLPGTQKTKKTRLHMDTVNKEDANQDKQEDKITVKDEATKENHLLQLGLLPDDPTPVYLPCARRSCTVHDEWIVHGSSGNVTQDEWRHTYVTAFRHADMVHYERRQGFRHSYTDKEALQRLRVTKQQENSGIQAHL